MPLRGVIHPTLIQRISMSTIPILTSIAALAPTADVWFVDIWGVIHNGERPYELSGAACRSFREQGGSVLLVTNAPRPRESVIAQLDRIGVDGAAYDDVVSSGDVSRSLIKAWADKRVFHIGPERDLATFEGLGAKPGASAGDADVAVCTGLFDDERETAADYAETLEVLKNRDTPMICANPDIKVERGGRIVYCAGAVARAYEDVGGQVSYAGKPFRPIYELALQRAAALRSAPIDKSRVLAIGDGISTDIAGADAFGIRSVYIASGVHVRIGETIADASARLFAEPGAPQPNAVMDRFVW